MSKVPHGILCVVGEIQDTWGFIPDGALARAECKERKLKKGQKVLVSFHNLRSWGTMKHGHDIGKICRKNLDDFSNCNSNHDVLKRLQLEGNIACDAIKIHEGTEWVDYRIPKSLKYEDMDEIEFLEVVNQMYRYISMKYWPTLSPEKVREMAELFGDDN